jgi:microcystin degradation protein MlrC
MGPTVVTQLETGQTVMLTSRRVAPFSLQQLTSCGVDPQQFQVVVAKGVHAPVAAYAPVCPTMLRVNTPGITSADMTSMEFHHRRKPLFPFEL